jgi:hypothetical protein
LCRRLCGPHRMIVRKKGKDERERREEIGGNKRKGRK